MIGIYLDYDFSNYVGGIIEVNGMQKYILLQLPSYIWHGLVYKDYYVPSITLESVGLSIPMLCSIYPFSNQCKFKFLIGISLDFPLLFSGKFTSREFNPDLDTLYFFKKEEIKEVAYAAAKKELRSWDLAGIVGLSYEFRNGIILEIRCSGGMLGLLKGDYVADKVFKSAITGIKNIKHCHTAVTLGYNLCALFE